MKKIVVLIGAGSIGQAIARRVSAGKHILLADLRKENADAAAKTLSEAGFEVTTAKVDVASRPSVEALVKTATVLGEITAFITGSDFLMDGGVTAAYWFGELAPK